MKVGIVDDAVVWTDGQRHSMPNPMNRLWEEVVGSVGEIVVCGPTLRVDAATVGRAYVSGSPTLRFSHRPYYGSPVEFFLKLPLILLPTIFALWRLVRSSDLVYLRLPSVVGLLAFAIAKVQGKPRISQIKGSWVGSAEGRMFPPLGLLTRRVVALFEAGDYFIARRTPTIVHTREAYRRAGADEGRVFRIATSIVSRSEIWHRDDTCQSTTIVLLFIGRLSPAKGLEYLLRALADLRDPRLELRIAGEGPEAATMHDLVSELGLEDTARFEGNLARGEPLLNAYRNADIFVLPSVTEGVPKVIFEAMASGLPVVATRVGGIPDVIQHAQNGLLVGPRSPQEIVEAVRTLIDDTELRKDIISEGYRTVEEHTIEATAQHVTQMINGEASRREARVT